MCYIYEQNIPHLILGIHSVIDYSYARPGFLMRAYIGLNDCCLQ